jgi:RHS repeat-associated protein
LDTNAGGSLSVGDTDVTLYAYDQRNRLVAVSHVNAWTSTQAAGLAAFTAQGTPLPGSDLELRSTYDYADRRIRRSIDADGQAGGAQESVSFAAYAGDVRTLEIARPNDKLVVDSVRGPIGFLGQVVQRNFYGNGADEILAVDQVAWNTGTPVTSTFWTFTDHQDSVRDIVSGNAGSLGQVVEHRQYDSFGRIVRRTTGPQTGANTTPGVGIDFGYAGRPLEARTGLSDNRARWYEPATGRFVNEDPSGFRGGDANLFRYVGNDPLNQVDPSGLAAKWASYAGGISTSATMGSAVTPLGWGALVQQNATLPKAASPSVSAMAYASLVRQPPQAAAAASSMFSMAPPAVMVSTSGGTVYSPVATSRSNAVQPTSASPYQSVYRTEVERVTAPLAGAGFANNGWNGNAAGYGAGTSNARGWADAAGNRWNTSAGEISAYGPPPSPPTWGQFAEAVSGIAVAIAGRGTGVRTNVGAAAKNGVRAGQAGAFGSLKGFAGDGLTAHHMPQAAAGRTSYREGGALVMTQAEHSATRTYGARGIATLQSDIGLSFREVLSKDIRDVRTIVGPKYNQGLRELIQYYRQTYPNLMHR